MKITYDKTARASCITLRRGRVAKTVEISEDVIVDFDKKGNVLSIEMLGVSSAPVMTKAHKAPKWSKR